MARRACRKTHVSVLKGRRELAKVALSFLSGGCGRARASRADPQTEEKETCEGTNYGEKTQRREVEESWMGDEEK